MQQITNLLTYQSKSPDVKLATYWTEIALSALATHAVFQRLKPSLTTLTVIGMGGTGYMIAAAAISMGEKTPTRMGIFNYLKVGVGFVAGFQFASLGWAVGRCWSGAFGALLLPAKLLVAPALLFASTEVTLIKGGVISAIISGYID